MKPKSEIYTKFLEKLSASSLPRYVAIYHAVRNIPYGVTGERSAKAVLKNNIGSCSGKHLLLRDLLETAGYQCEIITIHTHFNKQIPQVPNFPDDLAQMVKVGEVVDYHHYVRIHVDGKYLNMDATWPDALEVFGFPVNRDWDGTGNTIIASDTIEEFPAVENLVKFKQQLVASLPRNVREKRRIFFEKFTDWMATQTSTSDVGKVDRC